MKKLLSTTMLLVLSIIAYAQQDVTRFLGIPVDGSKTEMVRKLKEKGFRYDPTTEALAGEFNGAEVNVYVVTNKNKVCRIAVFDANSFDKRDIQIRFNRLCKQFANNPKYMSVPLQQDYTIPEDENIGYEIFVNKKRYEAAFYQKVVIDTTAFVEKFKSVFLSKYTEEQLKNSIEELTSASVEDMSDYMGFEDQSATYTIEEVMDHIERSAEDTGEQLENPTEKIKSEFLAFSMEYFIMGCLKKSVWFMISPDSFGRYRIQMYYDNEYNRANGEDL